MLKHDTGVYFLYSTRNKDEIKYIGITSNSFKRRLTRHLWDYKKQNTKKDKWIRREIQDGFNIIIEPIITNLVFSHALTVEINLIKEAREIGLKIVNTSDGGDGYRGKHSPEHNAKKIKRGPKHTEEYKRLLSERCKGRKLSPEHRAKSVAALRRTVYTQTMRDNLSRLKKGKSMNFSAETKARIASFHIGRKKTPEENEKRCLHFYAPVIQMALDGTELRNWKTPQDVQRELKICAASIIAVCKGRRKTAGKFKWKYHESYKPRKRDYYKGRTRPNKAIA
jgi:hypothetical protein